MAHLNVHERRIEAKIAYVGAQLAGKATNFEHLRREPRASATEDDDEVLSLEWRPDDGSMFRDCDVRVKVVTQRGAFEADTTRELLRNADGVVLVVDAMPEAHERNRTSFAAVKEALAASPARQVPIVVQVNKSDMDGALPASEVARALETEALPHVVASALRGEGVVETLQRAVDEVLKVMREADGPEEAREDGAPFAADETRRGEGNPLLAALKQVLRETATAHVSELEARQSARLERHADEARIALERRLDDVRATLGRIEDVVVALGAAQAALQASVAADRERVERWMTTITRALPDVARRTDLADVARHADLADLAKRADLADVARRTDLADVPKRADLTELGDPRLRGEVETLRKDVKRDLAKVLEATTRAERDTAAALDTITGEVGQAARAALAVPPRLADVEAKMRGEITDVVVARVTSLERSVHAATADTSKAIEHVDGRTADVQEQLGELIEELKKRKKGWFG